MERKKIIEEAKKQYNEGNWEAGIDAVNRALRNQPGNDFTEAHRIRGWSYYYLGIKGEERKKRKRLSKARCSFKIVIEEAEDKDIRLSALNGLPLVLWILGEKEEAWKTSDEAIKQFSTVSSIWNTRGILCRWAKKFDEAVEIGQKVYETAVAIKDFRTAGHGKHNKADAFLEQARKEYQKAIHYYQKYEELSGQSAKPHIKRVQEKLSKL